MAAGSVRDRWIGRTIEDRYQLVSPLGFGGMGTVYRARHLRLGSDVAVKVVELAGRDSSLARRLEREARAVALIGHENIVNVIDFGRTGDGAAFLAMELLIGETVEERLDREGTISLATTCGILIEVAYALQAAHECGIVHRDIKPANIFLANERSRRDFVKVLDFGIAAVRSPLEGDAREALSGAAVFGTPEYVAPERFDPNGVVDHRADVYSLGATMYEMLSGAPPFQGKSAVDTVLQALETPLVPLAERVPDLPQLQRADELVAAMLARDPAARIADMRSVRTQLVELRQLLHEPTRRRAELLSLDPAALRRPLSAWVTTRDDTTYVELSGVLDHRSDLDAIGLTIVGPHVAIKVSQVTRVNSVGFQVWSDWLQGLIDRQLSISLHECSVAMVRQANLSPSFLRGLPVMSFHAPFYCLRCGYERLFLFQSEHLRTHPFSSVPCDACGASMALDDVEQTFLLFLRR